MIVLLDLEKKAISYQTTTPFVQGTDSRNIIKLLVPHSEVEDSFDAQIAYVLQSGRTTIKVANSGMEDTTETINDVIYNIINFDLPRMATSLAGNLVATLFITNSIGEKYKFNVLNNVLPAAEVEDLEEALADDEVLILIENLQKEINANRNLIVANRNIDGFVNSYDDLEEVNTTDLPVNAYYNVLTDETHDDNSTLYMWNGNTWEYVGFYNSYTKAQLDEILENEFTSYETTINNRLDAQDETIAGLGQLRPSGVDTSTNILAFTEDKGILIGSDTGDWYYWDAAQSEYVSGGQYLAVGDVVTNDDSQLKDGDGNNLYPNVNEESLIGKIKIKQELTSNNLLNVDDGKFGYYINASGVEIANETYFVSGYIPVIENESIYIKNSCSGVWFNSEKTSISTYVETLSGAITVPENASYLRVYFNVTYGLQGQQINEGSSLKDLDYYKAYNYQDANIYTKVLIDLEKKKYKCKNLLADAEWSSGYIGGDGNVVDNANYIHTNKIAVTPNALIRCAGYTGQHGRQHASFYSEDNHFIGGIAFYYQNVAGTSFIPNGAKYVIFDCVLADQNYFYLDITGTVVDNNLYFIVDKNGNGDCDTIQDCVSMIPTNNEQIVTIFIMPGTYDNEVIKGDLRKFNLIGFSKQDTIIKNSYGLWSKCPINAGWGIIKNLTVIAEEPSTPQTDVHGYAIHVENNILYNGNLTIENCILKNYTNYAFGMGMRGGCNIEIKDCDIYGYGGYGPVYFHDASNSTYAGEQNVRFINNRMFNVSGNTLMRVESQPIETSTVNVTFIGNLIRSLSNISSTDIIANNIGTHGESEEKDWLELYHFHLTAESWGNSCNKLNYTND